MKYLFIYFIFIPWVSQSATVRGQVCTNQDIINQDPGCCKSPMLSCSQLTPGNQSCCDLHPNCHWLSAGSNANSCLAITQSCTVDDSIYNTKKTQDSCELTKRNYANTEIMEGTCKSGYTGNCAYTCKSGVIEDRSNTCKADCSAGIHTETPNCRMPSANHHATNKTSGTCINGYVGDCSYRCNNGTWTNGTNTCTEVNSGCPVLPRYKGCPAIPATQDTGWVEVDCLPGYSSVSNDKCRRFCTKSGGWHVGNNCYRTCPAQTIDHCILPETKHTSYIAMGYGRCQDGYKRPNVSHTLERKCFYRCSAVLGKYVTDMQELCQKDNERSCKAKTVSNCKLLIASHNSTRNGSCVGEYSGSCSYRCNNSNWTAVTNECKRRCSGTHDTAKCPSITRLNHNSTQSRSCNFSYSGSCTYTCNDGTLGGSSSNCKRRCSGTPDSTKCPSVTDIIHNTENVITRACKSGYSIGRCTYTCNDGTLTGSSKNCKQDCPRSRLVTLVNNKFNEIKAQHQGETIDHPVVPTVTYPHVQSPIQRTRVIINVYRDTETPYKTYQYDYYCNNGTWQTTAP